MEKEILLRKMRLSKKQDNVSNLAVSNNEERKQLWEEWKKQHPESKKIWRSERAKDPNTLRCQAAVIIKKVSATIETEEDYFESIHSGNSSLWSWSDQRSTDSIHSEDSERDRMNNGRSNSIQNGSQDSINSLSDEQPQEISTTRAFFREEGNTPARRSIIPDREFLSENPGRKEKTISKLYINEEILAEWAKENLTAFAFPIEYPRIRALSEVSRYELKRFHTFIPEELLKTQTEEEEFYEEFNELYQQLEREDIKTEWITFLCHEELKTQGDVDDHALLSHGFDMSDIKDEYRIGKIRYQT